MTTPTDPPGEAEARRAESEPANEVLAKRLKGVDWRPGCLLEQSARRLRSDAARIAALEAEVARLRGENADVLAESDALRFTANNAFLSGFSAAREAAAAVCDEAEAVAIDDIAWVPRSLARDIRALRPAQAQQAYTYADAQPGLDAAYQAAHPVVAIVPEQQGEGG